MIINLKNETELSALYFIYNGSTNLEKTGLFGVSHFLEHIKCKAFDDLMDELQSNGISWNAYTGSNQIVFYFKGLEEYLAIFRETLIERMYIPFENYITKEVIEKEKKIVIEEYNDSFTDQRSTFHLNLFRKKFNHYSPIGLKEDIKNLSYKDCLDFYNTQYQNPDQIINVSKSFILEKDLKFENRIDTLKSEWVENLEAPLEKSEEYPNSLVLYYYQQIQEKDISIMKIIGSMLGTGLNSPLYQEIREKRGLCYGVGTSVAKLGKMPLIITYIMTSPEKMEIVNTTLNEVFINKEIHMTSERLETIRKSQIISKKKSLINRHENISDILDSSVDELNNIIEKVSLEEIMSVYNEYFDLNRFTMVTDKSY